MSLLRSAISRASLLAPRAAEKSSRACYSVQAGPATHKISKVELALTKVFLAAGIMGYPFWVIFHVEEYKRIGNTRE